MIKVSRLVLAALFLLLFSGMSFGQEMGAGESGPGTGGIGGSSASMIVDPSIFGSSSSTGGTDWSKCTETVFIGTAGALKEFASSVNNGNTSLCGRLTDDIDLNGGKDNQWTPIGTETNQFVGTFDGQGHTIKGLYVDNVDMNYVGLFGNVNGVVKNVGVMDSHIKGWAHVGGVVGNNVSGSVSNVYNTGFVNGEWDVGGVVGYNGGIVSNVYNTGAVSGTNAVGGVVGGNNGTVSNAYYNTDFYAGNAVGGGDASGENVEGKTTLELASKTLPDGFDENVWVAGSISIGDDGSVTFGLPYLNGQSSQLTFKLEMDVNKYLEISTALQLKLFAQLVNSGETSINGKLTADICLNACNKGESVLKANGTLSDNASNFTQWTPIGTSSAKYTGTFDGNGHTIRGLYFNNENTSYVGLFGCISGSTAKVQNVGVVDSYFKGGYKVGGVVGDNGGPIGGGGHNGGTVSNVYNTGAVSGKSEYVGGVVGHNGGTVSNVYNTGSVTGYKVGGVVGGNSGTVSNVYNTGSVRGTGSYVGGVVGLNYGTISNGFFNTAYYSGNAIGESDGTADNVKGLSMTDLANLAIDSEDVFPLLFDEKESPWITGSVDVNNAVCKFPYLQVFGEASQPQFNVVFITITNIDGGAELGTVAVAPDSKISLGSVPEIENCGIPSLYKDVDSEHTEWDFKNDVVTENISLKGKCMDVLDGVYQIASAQELMNFASIVNRGRTTASAVLTQDIDMNQGKTVLDGNGDLYNNGEGLETWIPIGTSEKPYKGTFDGKGHTIRGLYFNDVSTSYVGLFGYISGSTAKVQNVGVVDSYFKGDYNVGGLVGSGSNLTITNSYNAGTVSGGGEVGGLVGSVYDGTLTITNSYNVGTVSGGGEVGGLVGYVYDGTLTITNSYNAGTVMSGNGDGVGGLVGRGDYGGTLTITNSYNAGTVSGDYSVGGLVGYDGTLTITNSYNAGTVSGSGNNVGGLVGNNNGENVRLTITNSYNAGTVSGSGNNVGGLVGRGDYGTLTITNSFFLATDKSGDALGGEAKTLDDFHNGTVAKELHDWCEMDGETCKEGGLNGSIWGQDLAAENSLPDFSGVVGFKYGSITFFNLNDDVADSASIDATAKAPVSIPKDIAVSEHVTFKRSFAVGYSTMMLPFSVSEENLPDGLEFYSFDEVEEIDGKYTAKYTAASVVEANKPYIVKNSGESALSQVTFNGEFTLKTDFPASSSSSNGWEFKGTYEYKTWKEGDAGLGRTYGFAANDGVNAESIVGKFAKIAAGAYIYPMRAYLEYDAPTKLGRPAANGVAANTVASLPDEIDVVIVDKDETSGEETTKVIGTINTRTGEFKFANDRWFDLNGRYLGNKKPTQKGAYYNNGKKGIVK